MVHIFIDFDGTISRQDVGDAMFETFGGKASVQAIDEYRQGSISAAECFRRESAACGEVDRRALDAFLDGCEIDETFVGFIRYCKTRGFLPTILSDGMDYYINRILRRFKLGDVQYFSNELHLDAVPGKPDHVRFVPVFPYVDEVCDRCACCKRNHMITRTGDDDILVYIGEGYSDRCPVRYADVVFAKDELLKYCQQENISFYEYRTFADVRNRLEMLAGASATSRHRLRKRRNAVLARRDACIGG